jgi:hypothetical protein
VYVLDEPLMVGQGGGDVQSEAAVGDWQQQRQQWGQQQHQQRQHKRPGKVRQLDPASKAETDGPVEELRLGQMPAVSNADVAAMEVEGAPAPVELPAAGAIKFAPTGVWDGGGLRRMRVKGRKGVLPS